MYFSHVGCDCPGISSLLPLHYKPYALREESLKQFFFQLIYYFVSKMVVYLLTLALPPAAIFSVVV